MRILQIIILVPIVLTSCEKEISIDLNSADSQVVIEGAITDQSGPYFVRISKTVNFSDGNNFPPVSNALVIISDNIGTIDTLTETTAGIYRTNRIIGQPGRTYNLEVFAEETSYFASSTMPQRVNLDSLKFSSFGGPGVNGYIIVPVFTDPAASGNSYRFLITVNDVPDKSYIVFDDIASNGIINERPIFSPDAEIELGDSVMVEFRCIDTYTYIYYYTLSQILGSGPGGGTTPTNPPNNITGSSALGFFSAYTIQKRTQLVQ